MSLVERAVKRLEDLEKTGLHGAPEPAREPREEALTTIERAVQHAEGRGPGATGEREGVPDAIPHPETPRAGARVESDDHDVGDRREPTLGAGAPASAAVSTRRSGPPRGAQPTQRIELDFKRLSSEGFIDVGDPDSAIANEFRRVKRPLIRACQGRSAAPVANANRIMVTSSVQGEGKSFIALNLALSMAMERDFSVVLVDADTTRRSLSKRLGIANKAGLLDLLEGDGSRPESALLRTSVDRLELLPAGASRPHATELLASDAMERVVEALASRYSDRILVFDTPPLLGASEPAVLATHMGQIIVVVEAGRTTRKLLGNALATVESCPVVMTILNKTSGSEVGYHYYETPLGDG